MCTLLYPDVIVASKVNDSFEIAKLIMEDSRCAMNRVYITVKSCLAYQEICKNMGVENVFTGNSEREWEAADYEKYFEQFPQYFEKESGDNSFYKVNLFQMLGQDARLIDSTKVAGVICEQLLNNGAYSPRTLGALGLI